jgi:hypothetical protein
MACFIVRDLEETDVAKELATSLAPRLVSYHSGLEVSAASLPIFQASRKAKMVVMAKM